MSGTSSVSDLAAEIVAAARRRGAARALILDLDGTLAPLANHPRDAWVPGPVLESLRRLLEHGWRIAIVSGRSRVEASRLAPVAGVEVSGSHGIEGPGEAAAPRALRAAGERSARIARAARRWVREFPGAHVERKPFGCAFHYRMVDSSARARFLARLRAWLPERDLRGLDVLDGRDVVELRPSGLGKGLIARRWPAARSAGRDASLVAIGDDLTDEDLFAALAGHALTVRVGRSRRSSRARRRLSGPRAVHRLLGRLAASFPGEERDERA